MDPLHPAIAAFGGMLIGASATLLLLLNGRIAGVSGILNGLMSPRDKNFIWKSLFLAGMLAGGLLYSFGIADISLSPFELSDAPLQMIVAGILVGFGTRLGSGCTSGHGVCGLARLSKRSLLATLIFMFFGILTVYFLRHLIP